MRRIVIIIGVVILLVLALSLFGLWLSGTLFFRLPSSRVSINGAESATSSVYRSGNGDYLIFLDPETAQSPVYKVLNEGKSVGVPVSPVPSSYTKSVKTESFVLCLQCSVVLAGTDKLDLRAEVSTTSEGINFHVYEDTVNISF
jgi:hypothetical protein